MTSQSISRRGLLGLAGAAAGSMLLPSASRADEKAGAKPEGFRFVHLTDIHIQPELKGDAGLRKCLAAVHDLNPRPDFILTGGDLVFDVLAATEPRCKALFDLLTGVFKDCDIPIRHCVGNHDVLGWSPKSPIEKTHLQYGKKMAQDRLALDRTTYSFDHKGWHFAVVDDIQPNPQSGYEGGFSEADMHWLEGDLAGAGDRPKVICTHIPVMSVTVFRNADVTGKGTDINVSKGSICRNVGPILNLLRKHSVNLVLSGHQHQNERITFEKTTHIEDAAVCGAWWKGAHCGFPEGFGVIDVKPDGAFEHSYHTYGWTAEKA